MPHAAQKTTLADVFFLFIPVVGNNLISILNTPIHEELVRNNHCGISWHYNNKLRPRIEMILYARDTRAEATVIIAVNTRHLPHVSAVSLIYNKETQIRVLD